MATEIEAKFRLTDPAGFADRVRACGGRDRGRHVEQNTYFDWPDEALRRGDRGVRIRVNTADDGRQTVEVTYKGPRQPGTVKIRQEEQVHADSADAARAIFEGLGLRAMLEFQKRRQEFDLDGAIVCLDELPELGWFAEVEAADTATVDRVCERLGLDGSAYVADSYIALVARLLAPRGTSELSF